MPRTRMDTSELVIGEPTTAVPPRSQQIGEASESSRKIIIGVMGLKDGAYLPVACPNPKAAAVLASRQGGRLFKSYGIKATVRGQTAYFYKGQKASTSEVNHQDQRLPLPPLST